jgi:hypothetical protein
MREPQNEHSVVEQTSDRDPRLEWHAPTLKMLGDAHALTLTGGTQAPDGGASSALS